MAAGLQVMTIGVGDGSAENSVFEGSDFGFVQFDLHAAEIVHNIRNLLEGEENVLFDPHADVLADDPAQDLGTVVIVYAVNPAVFILSGGFLQIGFLDQRVTDERGQHDAVGTGIQGEQDDTVCIAVHVLTAAGGVFGNADPVRTGIPDPLVDTKQKIMMLPFHHGRKLIIRNNFNAQRCVFIHMLFDPLFRGERDRRFGRRRIFRENRDQREQCEHKDQSK